MLKLDVTKEWMSTWASWQDKGTLSSQGFHADQTAHKCTSAEQLMTVSDKSGQIEMETDGTFHKEMNARKLFMTRRGSETLLCSHLTRKDQKSSCG